MGFVGLFYPWGIILQALALAHFVRRRPETFWLWIILIGGGLGALVYIVAEVAPDVNLLGGIMQGVSRRRRIRALETVILDNPSVGNHEELADLYSEEGKFDRARELYDKVITPRTTSLDPFYRRGIAALETGDIPAAVADLNRVVSQDSKYDFHRAIGLLAHACAQAGQPERAAALFEQATALSTLSETYYHYAAFLAAQGHPVEAREWAERILAKKPTMPQYLRRRERPWFQKASALIKSLPGSTTQ
jgi:hypothetical protein